MDPQILPATWQEAFQKQSISSIRVVEKELRASVLQDRERLRALVGNNYRDLLATAEKIVTLAEDTGKAESGISALSQACKPKSLNSQEHPPADDITNLAQLKFLGSTLRCASSAIQRRALILASKLLVISRLVLKHLEEVDTAKQTLQWLQARLRTTRQNLVATIDVVLIKSNAPLRDLAEAITAYCLVTSSPSSDALKHFQQIRTRRITQGLPLDKSGKASTQLLRAKCHYLIATVTALRALSGRIVNELLNDLQKRPILESDDISSFATLQLDLYKSLLPADIVSFVPYFKRITSTSSESQASIQAWVDDVFDSIVGNLESLITNLKLSSVLQVRQDILYILLPACFSALLYRSALSKIRAVFTVKIVSLVESQARTISRIVERAPKDHMSGSQHVFWELSEIQPEQSRSTNEHIKQLRNNQLGVNGDLQPSIRVLQKWAQSCERIKAELQAMEKTRWKDKLEEIDDDDDSESQAVIIQLSKEDPEIYSSKFSTALREGCDTFFASYATLVHKVQADDTRGLDTTEIVTLLRLGREVFLIVSGLLSSHKSTELSAEILSLQHALAHRTSAQLFEMVENTDRVNSKIFFTEELPSPVVISVLRSLASVMLKNGGIDLWTPNVNAEVRRLVFERAISTEHRKHYIRGQFDFSYLAAALNQSHAEPQGLTVDDGEASQETTLSSKSDTNVRATAYWKRTRVLFGIFASQ